MKSLFYCAAIVFRVSAAARADQQTTQAGQQLMTARRARNPVVIDGAFSPGEWSAAIPVHVNAVKPATAPGLVPWQGLPYALNPPDNPDDSSFTVYSMYDTDYLYVAVDVADDRLFTDSPDLPFLDDDVEIFIDGDNQPFDLDAISCCSNEPGVLPNNEGFQLVTSAGNVAALYPDPALVQVNWDTKSASRPRGYLVETRISLDSINTLDTSFWTNPNPEPGFRRPEPGDSIGFNITVGDDDSGGDSSIAAGILCLTPAATLPGAAAARIGTTLTNRLGERSTSRQTPAPKVERARLSRNLVRPVCCARSWVSGNIALLEVGCLVTPVTPEVGCLVIPAQTHSVCALTFFERQARRAIVKPPSSSVAPVGSGTEAGTAAST